MKAKEYAEKYAPLINRIKSQADLTAVGRELYLAYAMEVQEICKTRNIKLDTGFKSVLREQNQKWNAMVRLLEASGINAVRENGFELMSSHMLEKDKAG